MLDPDWWRRHHILLTGMVREDYQKIQQGVFDYHRALVANAGLTEDSFKSAQENARDSFYDMVANLRPWEGGSAKERKEREMEDMRMAWFEAFGIDPNDPEWEEKNRRDVEAWKEEREELKRNAPEDDYDRIMRMRAEREAHVSKLREKIRQSNVWQGS